MMKFYGTMLCKDCLEAREALNAAGVLFDYVDITTNIANLKDFLRLRDGSDAFDAVRKGGSIGIPCYVMDDGSVCLDTAALLKGAQ